MPELRLITIPISHYCEKARWALDLAGMPYREERHIQAVHRLAVRRAGGGLTVPVLVTPDGVIGESAEILVWVDRHSELDLFPAETAERNEVDALCRRFDEVLGPTSRRLVYVNMFGDRKQALSFNNAGVPGWEDRITRFGWPVIERIVKRVLDIQPGAEVQDAATVWGEFDFVAEQLSDGRRYLAGERFGAADLTFAALSSAVVVPTSYGVPLPQPEEMQPAAAALVRSAREHPAGQYALRMFAEHRRRTAQPALVHGDQPAF